MEIVVDACVPITQSASHSILVNRLITPDPHFLFLFNHHSICECLPTGQIDQEESLHRSLRCSHFTMPSATGNETVSINPLNSPRLPDDIFRHLIQSSPKSIQRLFMPLNHRLYDITAPILYRDVTLRPNNRHTILDGLPIGKWVAPLSSRYKKPPASRKRDLLKLIKVLRVDRHRYLGGISTASDAGKLEYTFPNVRTLHAARDCNVFGIMGRSNIPCSLVHGRGLRPEALVTNVSSSTSLDGISRQLDCCASVPAYTYLLVDLFTVRYGLDLHMDLRSGQFASTRPIIVLVPHYGSMMFPSEVSGVMYSLISYLSISPMTIVGAERLFKMEEVESVVEPTHKEGIQKRDGTIPWRNSDLYRRVEDKF